MIYRLISDYGNDSVWAKRKTEYRRYHPMWFVQYLLREVGIDINGLFQ